MINTMFGTRFGRRGNRGMTLIDTIIGIAMYVIIFLALFAGLRVAISIIADNKAKTGALALADQQMELIKSLPYDSIGTSGGIPSGSLAQISTTTLNVTQYTIRTLIQYIDLPQDGLGGADQNGITADAKEAKVEVTWNDRDLPKALSLVSTMAPKGLENLAGGGTLRINVFDAAGVAVPSAQVRVENATLVPVVDVTTFSNSSGVVLFPGAAAGGSYKITVTKSGFSTTGTYDSSGGNPNPNPGHLTIAVAQTTTGSFAIDALGSLVVRTFSPVQAGSFSDSFTDTSKIKTLSQTVVASGNVSLDQTAGNYFSSGTALSTSTSPTYLANWTTVSWSDSTNASTSIVYRVKSMTAGGVATLIPDSDLPGNSAGFTSSPIDISSLSVITYPRLALEGTLTTADVAFTPSVLDWTIGYAAGPTPLPSIPFSVRGTETIGTTGGGSPIYKYTGTGNSGGSGSVTLSNIEWDTYQISIDPAATGYDVMESCSPQPVSLSPGATLQTDLTLVPKTTNSLLLALRDASGTLLTNVGVALTKSGFSANATSTPCGQIFFSGLVSGTYTATATLSGYQPEVGSIDVTGPTTAALTLEP